MSTINRQPGTSAAEVEGAAKAAAEVHATGRLNLAAISVLLLLLGACGDDGTFEQPILISQRSEIALGAKVHEELIKEFGEPLPSSHALTQFVENIGNQLVPFSERPEIPHKFFVLDHEMVNAFAGPGGYIYVTTGLLRQVGSTSELVGVIAHEVGHVSEAHAIRRLQWQLGASYLTDVVLGKGTAKEVADLLVAIYLNTGYSRDNEFEADAFAVEATASARFNPWGLVSFFEYIESISEDQLEIFKYLSSHPTPEERIKQAMEIIEANYPDAPHEGGSDTFRSEDPEHPWSAVQSLL